MVHENQDQGANLLLKTPKQQGIVGITKSINTLYAVCAFLVAIDLFVHKHGPFAVEHIWGFYVLCGLVASIGLVVVAKVLRVILMKPEDYYDQ